MSSADGNERAGGLLRLAPDCSLKLIEEPAVYNRATDELYFVSEEAVPFLSACATGAGIPDDDEGRAFVAYCLEEGILQHARVPGRRGLNLRQSPVPSLRYLLLHITDVCNLACAHCFQAHNGGGSHTLTWDAISGVVEQFEELQGLRLMVSGGEPLLHPDFWRLNELVATKDLRSILLTNGLLINAAAADALSFNEVQVSLDGIAESHDLLRGRGTFEQAVAAVRMLVEAGIQVSIATMIHAGNLDDFGRLERLVHELGAREWSIDLPSPSGRMTANRDLLVDPAVAGPLLNLSFGGAIHEPAPGYACGAHLMAVMADAGVARCGFYGDSPVGAVTEGLSANWERVKRVTLDELECDCEHLAICRGGCRFRAAESSDPFGADPCQCYRYGVR